MPQMFRVYKTKSVEDISINSIIIKIIACALYTIHGFLIWDMPLLSMTAVVLVQYITIFFQYKYFHKAKKCDANIAEFATPTTHQITTENADPV